MASTDRERVKHKHQPEAARIVLCPATPLGLRPSGSSPQGGGGATQPTNASPSPQGRADSAVGRAGWGTAPAERWRLARAPALPSPGRFATRPLPQGGRGSPPRSGFTRVGPPLRGGRRAQSAWSAGISRCSSLPSRLPLAQPSLVSPTKSARRPSAIALRKAGHQLLVIGEVVPGEQHHAEDLARACTRWCR